MFKPDSKKLFVAAMVFIVTLSRICTKDRVIGQIFVGVFVYVAAFMLQQNSKLWNQTDVILELKVFQFLACQNVGKKRFCVFIWQNNATTTTTELHAAFWSYKQL